MTDDEKRATMRTLSDDDRRRMIDESPNVIGFDRFTQQNRQVALRDAYRKPVAPGPGGQA